MLWCLPPDKRKNCKLWSVTAVAVEPLFSYWKAHGWQWVYPEKGREATSENRPGESLFFRGHINCRLNLFNYPNVTLNSIQKVIRKRQWRKPCNFTVYSLNMEGVWTTCITQRSEVKAQKCRASRSAYCLNYCSSTAFTTDSTCQYLQERITVAPNQSTPLGFYIPARARITEKQAIF